MILSLPGLAIIFVVFFVARVWSDIYADSHPHHWPKPPGGYEKLTR